MVGLRLIKVKYHSNSLNTIPIKVMIFTFDVSAMIVCYQGEDTPKCTRNKVIAYIMEMVVPLVVPLVCDAECLWVFGKRREHCAISLVSVTDYLTVEMATADHSHPD